jgi:hypothetical protein
MRLVRLYVKTNPKDSNEDQERARENLPKQERRNYQKQHITN